MAEMNEYHTQKVEDLKSIAVNHLDGEIAFYEQVVLSISNSGCRSQIVLLDSLSTKNSSSNV